MKPILLAAAIAFTLALAAVAGISLNFSSAPAQAQDATLPAPSNVQAADGPNPGEVAVSWNAVAGAPFYRIGWVAYDDIDAARADGREWLDAFAFSDVANRGQTSHTIKRLTPCLPYAFIAASLNRRFGDPSWSQWALLTPGEGSDSCPTPAATPTPRPTPTGDYDSDKDGLIEISNLAQLNAIGADLDGDGLSTSRFYASAFPNAMPGMGCPDTGCTGYELIANLDFDTNGNGAPDAGDAYWNNGAGWIPIGHWDTRFTADFDGNNHTIANLYIDRSDTDTVGLFGSISGSSIKRVGLVSATVSGHYSVGSLVGYGYGSVITASYATGSVRGGNSRVGGLIGRIDRGTIVSSYATSNVSGKQGATGGLVGYSSHYSTIIASYAMGSVFGGYRVGGLVGGNALYSTITASYATGRVSGNRQVGGLVGWNEYGTITSSYAIGHVSATSATPYIGGLVGDDKQGTTTASYWNTETTGQAGSYGGIGKTTAELQSPTDYTGIYAGWNLDLNGDGSNDDPWHFGNSRQYPELRYGGLDAAQLLTPQPTRTGTTDYDTDQDGLIEISNLAQLDAIRADLNGDGISPAPAYAAAFPNAMPGMGCPDDGCIGYELVANLDFDTNGNGIADAGDVYWNNGAGWTPIGDDGHEFTADIDGNNHTIANLYINRRVDNYVSLFGNVSGSSIRQVGLVSVAMSGGIGVGGLVGVSSNGAISGSYVTGSLSGDSYVGALVGLNYGSISGSYATGNVSGRWDVGGLVGSSGGEGSIGSCRYFTSGSACIRASGAGSISGSYATGSVSGDDYVGGLAGSSRNSTITASYAAGSVSGSGDDIGGLVGRDSGTTITASYAVGRVSASGNTSNIGGLVGSGGLGFITASYWDTETTGQAGSYGGIGKTTAELQSPTDYAGIYAGWNLDLDGDRAVDNPWHFGNSRQYPVLQYASLDPAAQRP